MHSRSEPNQGLMNPKIALDIFSDHICQYASKLLGGLLKRLQLLYFVQNYQRQKLVKEAEQILFNKIGQQSSKGGLASM